MNSKTRKKSIRSSANRLFEQVGTALRLRTYATNKLANLRHKRSNYGKEVRRNTQLLTQVPYAF